MTIHPKRTVFLILVFLSFSTFAQDNKEWEKILQPCEVELKIKGTSKHDASDKKLALKYKEIELVWLHFEKSMKKGDKIEPIRVYLVSETLRNGSQVEYIIKKTDKEAGYNAPIFPDWGSKKEKFYKADCFFNTYKKSE